ncbi:MAG: hypothetical protein A2X36_06510 [Elusimicrobia bacterium GWA2_69_24]|nr:MAG: hypothetical protein A2X36_06510 [Elusimicrobia bacterium GWA2_69_24]HBL18825.1 NADH-quinone oxidoreductase subunit D [Elusimicrobiota bacterium]
MNATATQRRTYLLNMGPSHPAMHGVIRLLLELDGERVVKADAEIGYLHRAFEKQAEDDCWNNVIPYTDRLNYVSPLINNVGYCLAVEKLCGIETPERCQYLRVIASEISRVTDHLTCVGASAMELGAFTVFLYLMQAREVLYFCVDKLTGARITTSYTRIGGVKADLPEGFETMVHDAFRKVREAVRESDALLTRNRIFMDRMRGIGVLPRATALAYGVTGPLLRAAGVPYDLRRAQPYLVYDKLDFEVPVGSQGDNFDRYLVRLAEIEQGMRIVEQCLRDMPAGPVRSSDPRLLDAAEMADAGKRGETGRLSGSDADGDPTLEGTGERFKAGISAPAPDAVLPTKERAYGSIEGLMNHFELVMWGRGVTPPPGETYFAVEAGNGELGFHVVSDGSRRPYRVRVRPPCFFNMAALHTMLEGGTVADIIATFGSINMIAGELDR